jgi:hypothetical protein
LRLNESRTLSTSENPGSEDISEWHTAALVLAHGIAFLALVGIVTYEGVVLGKGAALGLLLPLVIMSVSAVGLLFTVWGLGKLLKLKRGS